MVSCLPILIGLLVVFEPTRKTEISCHNVLSNNSYSNASFSTLYDLLGVAENVLYTAKQYVKVIERIDTKHESVHPMDCAEIYKHSNVSKSGIHTIWPRSRVLKGPITVYCDMDDDGGAWTVIQRRGEFDSPKDYFYRDWKSYKNGFGDLMKDFWLGNDNIFALTSQRANLVKFDLKDWEGNHTYATYDDFWIDDETHKYTMHVASYRGTAGDSFTFANDQPFTTKDMDNDKHDDNCAVLFKGAWWYTSCHSSNLNGQYLKGAHESYADGIEWLSFRGLHYSLKDTVIKIRPKDFGKSDFEITPQ